MTPFCLARSKPAVRDKPDSYFICTREAGHVARAHTARDACGHLQARWTSETSSIETWVSYAGFTQRVVIP